MLCNCSNCEGDSGAKELPGGQWDRSSSFSSGESSTLSARQEYPNHNQEGQQQHLNPRARLRQWEIPGRPGWMYFLDLHPTHRQSKRLAAIRSATVARGLWSEATELRLKRIEDEAKPALDKLLAHQETSVSASEREALSRYISSLWRRGRSWLAKQPAQLRPEVAELLKAIQSEPGLPKDLVRVFTEEAEKMSAEPPARPEPLEPMTRTVKAMRWELIRVTHGLFASDTPVWMPASGVVAANSEIVLPLSPSMALVSTWRLPHDGGISVFHGGDDVVREINRRTVQGASRHIFSDSLIDTDSVESLLRKGVERPIFSDQDARRVPESIRQLFRRGVSEYPDRRQAENSELLRMVRHAATSATGERH